jgi:hypothetical protein
METILYCLSCIPPWLIVVLGCGATLKYFYQIFYKKDMKVLGAFLSTLYMTLVYVFITIPNDIHAQPFVRVGIMLMFLDKNIVFWSERTLEFIKKKKVNTHV